MTTPPPTPSRDVVRREQSFPLIAVVQLVTFSVALVSCINFEALRRQMDRVVLDDLVGVLTPYVLTSLMGFIIGAAVGLGQVRKWRGFFLGGPVGAVVGLLIVFAFASPAPPLQACFACSLPLLSTIILRFRTS